MSDLPDFTNYSQVDLVQQTIAFLTNRPMYGAAQHVAGEKIINANSEPILFSINGKGVIYGGILYAVSQPKVNDDAIWLYIDDILTLEVTWYNLLKLNLTSYKNYGIWLNNFDEKNGNWCLSFMNGITFEENLYVKYIETEGNNVTICYNIVYALLTT